MKKTAIILVALSLVCTAMAQSNASRPQSFRIEKVFLPPNIEIDKQSFKFTDADGDNNINANENCSISFDIVNSGKGDAYNCTVRVLKSGNTQGIVCDNKSLSPIKSGEKVHITLPIKAGMATVDGTAKFSIVVDEPNGYGSDTLYSVLNTRKFDEPDVRIVQHKIICDDGVLQKKRNFKIQLLLQNVGLGVAKNVTFKFNKPDNVNYTDGVSEKSYVTLRPNEKDTLEIELSASAYAKDEENVLFTLRESYGKYAKDYSVPLTFGQQTYTGGTEIVVKGREREQVDIEVGTLLSDVDVELPKADKVNNLTFAVIIANENYKNCMNVDYALNDGNVFREYLTTVLGVPYDNIRYERDATKGDIEGQVDWLKNIVMAYGKEAKVIFYYAGHGIPDESNRTSYLLPTDGVSSNTNTCYKLDDIYSALGSGEASQIAVFIDACFSGANRGDGMLASTRGVALKAQPGKPVGNMVVLSAAQGDETALPYRNEQHGMFTYFLLKKLKETAGNTTMKDLVDYVVDNVRKKSLVINSKLQTPSLSASTQVGTEWEKWELK